ncbi:MAG: VOC family protein [Micrococcales bacterium]|nr:VOC family protein [Micrococcales bacterium]
MAINIGMVTFDTTDARALAAWWAEALETQIVYDGDGFFVMVAAGEGLSLGFQKVTDPTPGKNRLHLDMSAPNRDAQVERLKSLGAKFVAAHQMGPLDWVVLEDPDGNQFCLAAPEK